MFRNRTVFTILIIKFRAGGSLFSLVLSFYTGHVFPTRQKTTKTNQVLTTKAQMLYIHHSFRCCQHFWGKLTQSLLSNFPMSTTKEMPTDSAVTGHGRLVMPNEQVGLLNPCPFETHKLIQNTRCDLLMRNGKWKASSRLQQRLNT